MLNKKPITLASAHWILQRGPWLKSQFGKSGECCTAFLHAKRSAWSSHV